MLINMIKERQQYKILMSKRSPKIRNTYKKRYNPH